MPRALILSGFPLQRILVLPLCVMFAVMAEERRDCREQEYKDKFGNCIPCRQCDAGQELSKECGFGYGEDAQCVPCRASRFKEDRSLQKCKPCLDCSLLNRFQKGNCSTTNNAVCGDCLPGFYRKTKLSGFQDIECIPCGDPPPPYEPHCIGRVNLVPLQSTVTSPRDMALAAVICSALATVLLALFILCVIYCKRQLLEKKPVYLRSHDGPYVESELSCLDRRVLEFSQRPCCHCRHTSGQTCGPVHLIPSLCCDDTWSQGRGRESRPFHSQSSLNEGLVNPSLGTSQADVGCAPEPLFEDVSLSEACPPAQNSRTTDHLHFSSESTHRCSSSEEDVEHDLQSSGLVSADLEDGSNSRFL
ncbi:tumor necrosis factor receptor superfamily member 19-like [Myxocyprinus asiaticus]|uniref:tumor necrosis factor receptor superfamily member 19-like n=1 Tax=Myxocyprinus asiaticus TaxID=70543 RepID=UPI0022230686|nr:tumor necrosis factor receptor superfamily member 19-like [Myxocyprinus asiaticus]XP_051535411.1 tumor necrosis factor receptor superfamily member 19-like [Myxocyprinus asiaticus]